MLLCSSKIPVRETFTDEVLVQMAIDWVQESHNYNFDEFEWDHSSEFLKKGNKGETFQVGKFNDGQICAVHFCHVDNRSIHWCTDFILDSAEHILAFQLYRDAPVEMDFVPPKFSLPHLVTQIILSGYCADDNDIPVNDQPIYIKENYAEWVANLMLRKTIYSLPVVYISCVQDGHAVINPYMLADKLRGVAHVVFGTSRALTKDLRERTGGVNPYAGAIEIYYPNGNQRILPSWLNGPHHVQVYTIVNEIFRHLVQLRVEDRFSWSQLQSSKLRKQITQLTAQKKAECENYEFLEHMYEEIVAEKENTIQQLTEQLASVNAKNEQLEYQISLIKDTPVLIKGIEDDLYPQEQQSILCAILKADLGRVNPNSRRYHIIKSLLDSNKCSDCVGERQRKIKKCLHGYKKLTPSIKKELENIGFTESNDKNHVKMIFCDDPRYTATFSKTGSDCCGGDNMAHDIIRNIF